ncbi:MAG: hypothetical protein ACETWE_08525 [Candidatus Bathyarchaeia archaeon]|nr:OST3/OST6 family protein [Candidatus Bathyarchaeota archaeon]
MTTMKVDLKISSLSYFLRKTYRRLSASKSPYHIVALALIGGSIFLLGGGIYDILVKPSPYWVSQVGEIVFFYPQSLQYQFLGGSIIIMILYAMGALGLWMVYQSTRHFYKPRYAAILLLVGSAFTVLAFVMVESIIYNYKVHFGG